ncbi:MAG: putative Zn-dependent peptidase [Candidatus Krumholzibacteriia bacterium]|jgi:predicted Zn-dependent peptidase
MNLDPYRNETPPRRDVLPGGAVLLSTPMPSAHAVTLGVWLRTGSENEPAAIGGISHFLEHMVFKGTQKRTAFDVAYTFDRLGAAVDAFTTKDLVAFTIQVLPEYFQEATELLAEMLLEPLFDQRLTELEQEVVVEEIQEALDTPEDRLHDAFAGRVYGTHARGRPILGMPATVRSFDAGTLREYHARLFAPENLVISMAGNLREGFLDIVKKVFDEPSRPGPEAIESPVETSGAAAMVDLDLGDDFDPFNLTLNSPIIQSYFEIGNLGPSFHHADRIPVFVLTNMLGGGMSSRIFQAVREREGLAYTVYNYNDMGNDTGLVSCAGSCSPEKLERLQDVIRMEYHAMIHGGIAPDELDNNKAQIKSQLVFSLEGTINQMFRAARNEIYYGSFQPVTNLVDRIDSVTADDLLKCAKSYFSPEALLVAVHGPE